MEINRADSDTEEKPKSGWRQNLKFIGGAVIYMIPLFWLWSKDGYPDSLGVHITAHVKAGVIENWWYSYLLVERHQVWDIILFAYMWLPIVAFVAWLFRSQLANLNPASFRLHAEDPRDGPPVQ